MGHSITKCDTKCACCTSEKNTDTDDTQQVNELKQAAPPFVDQLPIMPAVSQVPQQEKGDPVNTGFSDADLRKLDQLAEDPISKFNGFWAQSQDLDTCVCQIEDGILTWRLEWSVDEATTIKLNERSELVMALEGTTLVGNYASNGMILWSDGDRWKRCEPQAIYNGTWLLDNKPVCKIKDGTLTWLMKGYENDDPLNLTIDGQGRVEMILEEKVHTGEVENGTLSWSDGSKWTIMTK